ncbi:hypothetical protein QTP86_031402 [Hemibagrus guttatus]|nr:hypothetical protein QTP86_031402 [Hemibagrus guttatus]
MRRMWWLLLSRLRTASPRSSLEALKAVSSPNLLTFSPCPLLPHPIMFHKI